jgi:hypothetical protein
MRAPLQLAHAAGVTVRECQFTPAGGLYRLVFEARSGGSILALDQITGLAPGDVIDVGAGVYIAIAALGPRPYEITLRHPLPITLPAWTPLTVVNVTIPGGGLAAQLAGRVTAGDGVLPLDAALDVEAVEIDGGLNIEYRAVGALTDGDGYYQLPGMMGAAAFYLDARAAGFQPLAGPVRWAVSGGQTANTVDFTLVP